MAAPTQLLALLVMLALAAAAMASSGRQHHHQQHRHRQHGRKSSARLTLVPAAPGASFAARARDDRHRHAYIRSTLAASRRRAAEVEVGASAFAMPLSSGAYTGTGQYFVRFRVGTPAQPFVLVADTGSDLTWVKCRGAAAAGSASSSSPAPAPAREFRPADSKSWDPIACSSDTCTSYVPFSLANCSTPASPCAYDYRSVLLLDAIAVLRTPPVDHLVPLTRARYSTGSRYDTAPSGGGGSGGDTAAAGRRQRQE
ncbi:hypothetical protein HU200_019121 [Digitaria exilis]|uniref:Peptidase A1 domain-containing protein n=1 Tax=Digitaria exilis TaxID=1010633 RepID=A0A835KHS2_9POAL|nr:hypothetical protein HU200_019121 [Digitaria exilis]